MPESSTNWLLEVASGFVLAQEGAFCTCYHVLKLATDQEKSIMLAMAADGRLAPVESVLAADRQTDLAILKLKGKGFTPLPLSPLGKVGANVRVISHPENHFYILTTGIISRYFSREEDEEGYKGTVMAITAEFGNGSSGAPVLDEAGNVIAIVRKLDPTYRYAPATAQFSGITGAAKFSVPIPELFIRECIPAKYIMGLASGKIQ